MNVALQKHMLPAEAVVQRCSVRRCKKVFRKSSHENTCAGAFLKQSYRPQATLLNKGLWHRCFPVNYVKLLRTPFFIEQLWWLLLLPTFVISELYLEACQTSMMELFSKIVNGRSGCSQMFFKISHISQENSTLKSYL